VIDDLGKNVKSFFGEFREADLRDLSTSRINERLEAHRLTAVDLTTIYAEKPAAFRGS